MCDVIFLVGEGPAQKSFKVQRSIISASSPVFRDLCYRLPKNDKIELPNVDPDDFLLLLRHIHRKEVAMESIQHAWNVLPLAKKFELSKLTKICRRYIVDNINCNNSCSIFEEAEYQEEGILILESFKFITNNAKHVFREKGLIGAHRSTVEAIFRQDCINIESESDVFTAILEWAKAECMLKRCMLLTLRDVIEPLLPNIRFLAMDAYDFMKEPHLSKIFSQEEILDILMNLVWPGSSKLPAWCNQSKNARQQNKGILEKFWSNPCLCSASEKKSCKEATMTFRCRNKGFFLSGIGFRLSTDHCNSARWCLATISTKTDGNVHTTLLEKHNVATKEEQIAKFEIPVYIKSCAKFEIDIKVNSTSPPIHYCKLSRCSEDAPFNIVWTQKLDNNNEKIRTSDTKLCFSAISYLYI